NPAIFTAMTNKSQVTHFRFSLTIVAILAQ
ncbi:MAG: hypothetical protein ACI8WB_004784, partial [Phenylobacterium sp.]